MFANKIITEISSLPIEQRVVIIDTLLKDLNKPDKEIDTQWLNVSRTRLQQIKNKELEKK